MIENPDRPVLSDEQLDSLSREELKLKWKQLQSYTDTLEETNKNNLYELVKMKNIILMNYVSSKEFESTSQFKEVSPPVTNSSISNASSFSSNLSSQANKSKLTFVDPLVNSIIIQLKKDLEETKRKKDELQLELNSTKFTQESQINKRLIAKCRRLLHENEELGKIISSGNVAQLEHDLAYHKQLINESSENEQNINSFLLEMDNQMDLMHSTILKLQENKINNDSEIASSKNGDRKSVV